MTERFKEPIDPTKTGENSEDEAKILYDEDDTLDMNPTNEDVTASGHDDIPLIENSDLEAGKLDAVDFMIRTSKNKKSTDREAPEPTDLRD